MASGTVVYNHFKSVVGQGSVDWVNDTIKVMLLTSTHTLNADDEFVSDINANEVSDASYSRVTLTGNAATQDDTNDQGEYDASNPTFTGLNNVTVDYCAFFKQVTDDTDSILISSHGVPTTTANGNDFELKLDTEGVWKLT